MVDLLVAVVVVFHWAPRLFFGRLLFCLQAKVDWVYFVRSDNTTFDVNVELKWRDHPNLACKDLSRL